MTSDKAPRCPLCGEGMREELGMQRRYFGCTERVWSCPRCLHRMRTEDVDPLGGDCRHEEGRRKCISM